MACELVGACEGRQDERMCSLIEGECLSMQEEWSKVEASGLMLKLHWPSHHVMICTPPQAVAAATIVGNAAHNCSSFAWVLDQPLKKLF